MAFVWNTEEFANKNNIHPPKEWFNSENDLPDLTELKSKVENIDSSQLDEIFNCIYRDYIDTLLNGIDISDSSLQNVMYVYVRDYYNSDTYIIFLKKFFLLEKSPKIVNYDDLNSLERDVYKILQLHGERIFYEKMNNC